MLSICWCTDEDTCDSFLRSPATLQQYGRGNRWDGMGWGGDAECSGFICVIVKYLCV